MDILIGIAIGAMFALAPFGIARWMRGGAVDVPQVNEHNHLAAWSRRLNEREALVRQMEREMWREVRVRN